MHEGLLVIRVVFGALMAAHGGQKIFGWFGGKGRSAIAGGFESMGFRPGWLFAGLASFSELISGVLLATGFLGPIGPALILAVMIVAALAVHWPNGLLVTSNGIELPLLFSAAAVGIALTGYGRYSLDEWLGLAALWSPESTAVVLIAGVLGGLANVMLRRVPAVARA